MDFRPYPKSYQLRGSQKEKDKPLHKERRPNRKRKKINQSDNNTIKTPSRYSRGQFSMEDKQKIDEVYGHACIVCGSPYIEYHHCKFLSGMGRGTWRNGIPLCAEDHRLAKDSPHKSEATADKYRQHKLKMYGEFYYMDVWDLYKRNLIPNTTDKAFEDFMTREQRRSESECEDT